MQREIQELRRIFNFKTTTKIGDVVVIFSKKNNSISFAIVKDMVEDPQLKNMWDVFLFFLQVPPREDMWKLHTKNLEGQETFILGGYGMFISALDYLSIPEQPEPQKGHLRIVK